MAYWHGLHQALPARVIQLQGLRNFAVGERIQERRSQQGNVQCRLQRVIENRSACAVGKIGEDDRVLAGQALANCES